MILKKRMNNILMNNISKEIINPSLDVSKDYAEIGLDNLLDVDLLKEAPVVKTLVAIIKTGVAVKERFFIKKFLIFLSEFKSNKVDKEALKEFRHNFKKNKKFRNKITEQILVIIEDLDSVKKSRILAYLFSAYISKKIDWERVTSLVSCLKSLQESTFNYLAILSRAEFKFYLNSGGKINELSKLLKETNKDFDYWEMEALCSASGIAFRNGNRFSITKLGQDLYKYGISKVLEKKLEQRQDTISFSAKP